MYISVRAFYTAEFTNVWALWGRKVGPVTLTPFSRQFLLLAMPAYGCPCTTLLYELQCFLNSICYVQKHEKITFQNVEALHLCVGFMCGRTVRTLVNMGVNQGWGLDPENMKEGQSMF